MTILVVLPLMPGMASYYYEMMEHIHTTFPFTVEILIFPIRRDDNPNVQLQLKPNSKIIMLPELAKKGENIESNAALEYLEHVIYPDSNSFFTDRVTCYIVSYNAGFIEKTASPTMAHLDNLITHYLSEMEWKESL